MWPMWVCWCMCMTIFQPSVWLPLTLGLTGVGGWTFHHTTVRPYLNPNPSPLTHLSCSSVLGVTKCVCTTALPDPWTPSNGTSWADWLRSTLWMFRPDTSSGTLGSRSVRTGSCTTSCTCCSTSCQLSAWTQCYACKATSLCKYSVQGNSSTSAV